MHYHTLQTILNKLNKNLPDYKEYKKLINDLDNFLYSLSNEDKLRIYPSNIIYKLKLSTSNAERILKILTKATIEGMFEENIEVWCDKYNVRIADVNSKQEFYSSPDQCDFCEEEHEIPRKDFKISLKLKEKPSFLYNLMKKIA